MSEGKLEKEHFDEVESVVIKKLRNKKKKLEKIIQTECKINSKEIKPTKEQLEMVASRPRIEGQIQELTEIKSGIRKETKKLWTMHKEEIKALATGESNQDNTIQTSLGSLADALLVNLLQNEYQVKDLLSEEDKVGLEAIMVPLKNLFTPPAEEIIYDRARECFLEIFVNYVKGSEDLIPGSDTTYQRLLTAIGNIPESVRTSSHRLDQPEEPAQEPEQEAEAQAEAEEETKVVEEEPQAEEAKPQLEEQDWNAIDQNAEEEDKEEAEQEEEEPEVEEKPKKEKEEQKISKKYVDDDGFTHIKPVGKSKYENRNLRGRGRRGGGKDKRDAKRQRAKVDRGAKKHYRGRGRGKHPHDKYGQDESGKKSKDAHGNHQNWHKGEVRVDKPAE